MRLKELFLLLLLTVIVCFYGCSQGKDKDCKGFFRWDVKTLTDVSGLQILSEIPSDSTISGLISVKPPVKMFVLSKKDGRLPRYSSEKHLVRVIAFVTKMNIQKDQDYHIVLKSTDTEASMIGEIPDPDCEYLSRFPLQQKRFRTARIQGDEVYKILKTTKKTVLVEVIGVPFWDAPHFWLRGSSRTGREIHPILEIRVLNE